MDPNPVCHPSPVKKLKCSFLDYVQLLMIGWAGWWPQTPSTTPLQPKKWNAHFWITFHFWWSAGLVNGLEPHPPPLSSQKNEMLIFVLHSTSDDRPGWSMDTNPVCHPSPAKRNEMLIFCLHSTSDDWLGWSMVSNPICHPSPAKKGNAHFCITFNFWWSTVPVDGLEPHLPPLSSQNNEMLIIGLHSTSDDWLGWSMDLNPVCHPSPVKKLKCSFLDYVPLLKIGWAGWWPQTPSATPLKPKKWNACFWIIFNFWWLAGQVNGLKPHLLPLSSQKNAMLIFGLHSTSDAQPGWSMDLNPICHPSPAKIMKCSLLDYIQLLMIGWAGQWTQTPSATLLQSKNWNVHFWITFNFWWLAGLVNGLKPHPPPLSS